MIATCTKCHQLYEAPETDVLLPAHACPRCTAVAELLAATEALVTKTRHELNMGGRKNASLVTVLRVMFTPALLRAEEAVAKVRAS